MSASAMSSNMRRAICDSRGERPRHVDVPRGKTEHRLGASSRSLQNKFKPRPDPVASIRHLAGPSDGARFLHTCLVPLGRHEGRVVNRVVPERS